MVLGLDFIPGVDIYELVLFLVEHFPYVISLNIILLPFIKPNFRWYFGCIFPIFIVIAVSIVTITSYEHAAKDGYDLSKPSLREALEVYIETGKGDLEDILYGNRYPPVFAKHELQYLLTDLITQSVLHLDSHNLKNMPVAYNKGNDWFRATLGEAMVYTSGIYNNSSFESHFKEKKDLAQIQRELVEAQLFKLDFVARAIDLQPGDKVLDIGCGWGTLVKHFTNKYNAEVKGVTLSSEQVKYFDENVVPTLPKGSKSRIYLQDAMKMLEPKKSGDKAKQSGIEFAKKSFDKITALEMAEHVGIRRYQEFLRIVKSLLKDDGVFYIQVAGFRRSWRFKDFIWGLFMGEHIFPGADASCPLGWVSTQLERAGFEVQSVNNLGTHYARTIDVWLKNWIESKEDMIKSYGENNFRRWEVFLKWSIKVAKEGSSTVFMITTTKAGEERARIKMQEVLTPKL